MKPQDFSASRETNASPALAGFALRILRGWHAGAQITVPPNETLGVGGREDCDIVLTDDVVAHATLQIRLAQSADGNVIGWHLRLRAPSATSANTDGEEDESKHSSGSGSNESNDRSPDGDHGDVIAIDTPMHIGELTVTVSRADAPWPAVHLPDDADDAAPSDMGGPPSTVFASDASTTAENGGTIDTAGATNGSMSGTHDGSHTANTDVAGHLAARDVTADTSADTSASASHAMDPMNRDGTRPADAGARDVAAASTVSATSAGGVPTHWLMAAGALAIIAALVALILVVPRQAPPPLLPSSPISTDIVTQIQHTLRAGGWTDGMRVDIDPQGRVTVAGWVRDEASRDRLSAALARLTPMPAMRIDLVTEAVQAARDAADPFGPFLTVDAARLGEIRVRGVILPPTTPDLAEVKEHDNAPLLTALQAALRAAIVAAAPNATLNDVALVTAEGAIQALGDAVTAADLPKAGIHWERIGIDAGGNGTRQAAGTHKLGQLILDAPPGTDAARLQQALEAFRQRYGDRVPIRTLIGGSRAALTPALLPFALVAVSSGLLPSVVVDGNVRLLPGGSYRGFRLVYVDDATVVFDRETTLGAAAPSQRIVLQR